MNFVHNLLLFRTLKEFRKSVRFWQIYRHQLGGPVFWGTVSFIIYAANGHLLTNVGEAVAIAPGTPLVRGFATGLINCLAGKDLWNGYFCLYTTTKNVATICVSEALGLDLIKSVLRVHQKWPYQRQLLSIRAHSHGFSCRNLYLKCRRSVGSRSSASDPAGELTALPDPRLRCPTSKEKEREGRKKEGW